MCHFWHEAPFEYLRIVCIKTYAAELMGVSGSLSMNKKKVEELHYLLVFGVLEVQDDLEIRQV